MAPGSQSLVSIPKFVLGSVEGAVDGVALSSDVVVSETFGAQHAPPVDVPANLMGKVGEVRARVDRPIKVAYKDDLRMVVNPASWEVEEFEKGGRPADRSDHRREIEAMMAELKRVTAGTPGQLGPAPALNPEEEEVVSQRLRDLGYL